MVKRKGKIKRSSLQDTTMRRQVEQWLLEGKNKTWIADKLGIPRTTLNDRLRSGYWPDEQPVVTPQERVEGDIKARKAETSNKEIKRKYEALLENNELLEVKLQQALDLNEVTPIRKIPKPPKGSDGEGTVLIVASDWHIEETVRPETIGGAHNEYNLDISHARAEQFFQVALHLTEIEQQSTKIENMVVALLGDFISSNIHDELMETCSLRPTEAIVRCTEYLQAGFDYLLKNSNLDILVQCHTGNHGRITKKPHVSTEYGNSLEMIMYQWLNSHYRDNDRIHFNIPESYHSFLDIYGKLIRFHHGHAIRGGNGIGGVSSPILRKIAKWDTTRRVDHDVFGHFHTFMDAGKFLINGSMIGYSPYAVQIGASVEPPQQIFVGFHSKRGKFVTRPILFDV